MHQCRRSVPRLILILLSAGWVPSEGGSGGREVDDGEDGEVERESTEKREGDLREGDPRWLRRASRHQSGPTTAVAPVEREIGVQEARSPGVRQVGRLLGPNLSFLSSSGATRAVCGFTGGRTRAPEPGSVGARWIIAGVPLLSPGQQPWKVWWLLNWMRRAEGGQGGEGPGWGSCLLQEPGIPGTQKRNRSEQRMDESEQEQKKSQTLNQIKGGEAAGGRSSCF